ncbi:IS630 family transposase [Patescibacteria group bacterium]|nr:IS630 family transposase [Patescibacteria group bacterium]
MRTAIGITITEKERIELMRYSRGRSTPARVVLRAKIVLLAAEGKKNKEIVAALKTDPQTVKRWRTRFAVRRLAGIVKDAPRGGRKPSVRERLASLIVKKTTQERPLDATHWSTRSLAVELGTNHTMIHRVWKAAGLKPHRVKTFKLSNDPNFAEKLIDVVGLYLNPPEHALVLCVDEKSQIQALDRTQPGLPMKKGRCGTMTHDYKRNGTTTLFAALELAEGKLIGTCMKKHRHQEWIKFLKLIDRETPQKLDLHLIADNYRTHKHDKVQAWLRRHPRFHIHFTPTSSSWLNMIEHWFRELTDKRIRRGAFQSVTELVSEIMAYIDKHNKKPKSFSWTAKADDILAKVKRARTVLHNVVSV